jgi:hypothetical protein
VERSWASRTDFKVGGGPAGLGAWASTRGERRSVSKIGLISIGVIALRLWLFFLAQLVFCATEGYRQKGAPDEAEETESDR